MSISQLVLTSELVIIDHGKYIVKVTAQLNQVILGTALAGDLTVEKAEDNARRRVMSLIRSATDLNLTSISTQEAVTITPPSQTNNVPTTKTQTTYSQGSQADDDKVKLPTTQTEVTPPPAVAQQKTKEPEQVDSTPNNSPVVNKDDRLSTAQLEVVEPTKTEDSKPSNLDLKSNTLPKPTPIDNSLTTPVNLVDDNLFSPTTEITNQEEDNTDDVQPQLDFSVTNDDSTTTNEDLTVVDNVSSNGNGTTDKINHVEEEKQPVVEQNNTTSDEPTQAVVNVDFNQIMAQTTLEMKRLGWTIDDGKKHLVSVYGKKSRNLLSDQQLIQFLQHLEEQPTPE